MGHDRLRLRPASSKSYTLPSSPTHSSEFEFTVSRKSSAADICPADELFYKGQLLPLHPSPRLSMVRTLLLSSTSSSSDTTTTASRDSTDSSSARPSSATDDELKHLTPHPPKKPSKYFSLPKLAVKRVSSGARQVLRRYLKKVKPLYEKLSPKPSQQQQQQHKSSRISSLTNTGVQDYKSQELSYQKEEMMSTSIAHSSFSGNLRLYNRGRSCFSSCPPSMGSSPSHARSARPGSGIYASDSSSMEDLQNAIQGAIMHCKNSMLQTKSLVRSNEI